MVVDQHDIAIGFNDAVGNYLGVGIYKYEGKSDHGVRVVYFDEIRGGDAQATYDDVAPGDHVEKNYNPNWDKCLKIKIQEQSGR